MIQSVCQVIDTTTPILLNRRRKLVNIWCHSSSTSHSNILKSSTRIPAKSERFNEVSPDYMSKDDVMKQKVKLLGIVAMVGNQWREVCLFTLSQMGMLGFCNVEMFSI